MRVVTFAPSLSATEEPAGGLALKGFPMTSGYVDVFPAEIPLDIVVAVCGLNSEDYDPVLYIVARSPGGERLSTLKFSWHWDDNPEAPVKFRVFAQRLPVVIGSEGVYSLELHEDPDAGDAPLGTFPLEIMRNPLAPPQDEGRFTTLRR